MNNCTYGPLLEEWRDVIGYEGLYKVSNYGEIKSLSRQTTRIKKGICTTYSIPEKKLKQINDGKGYVFINLWKDKTHKPKRINIILGRAFLNLDIERPILNHKNGIPMNNFVLNLEYTTIRENACHAKNRKKSSEYIGVHLVKPTGRWRSVININGKGIHLGIFSTEEEASTAYKKAILDFGLINKYTGKRYI